MEEGMVVVGDTVGVAKLLIYVVFHEVVVVATAEGGEKGPVCLRAEATKQWLCRFAEVKKKTRCSYASERL